MPTPDESQQFEQLLEFLKQNRGFDFTGYKRTTLQRRVHRRMETVGIDDYAAYLALLERDADEFTQLFNTLLINVTRFFRDEEPWTFLAQEILPTLLARRGDQAPIRAWSAGCASGEEAYTLAMLLAEALGPDKYRERVKIYATDADDDALATARSATYTEKQVADVPDALREKYFDKVDGRYVFTKELRRSVIFGRNDLVQDAPISRIDLLVCRNTLMYFNAATQAVILARFHFALADQGVLFLGRAETLLTQSNAFVPIDIKRRIFGKAPRYVPRERLIAPVQGTPREAGDPPHARLRDSAFEAGAEAQIVVDRLGQLTMVNERARQMFGLTPADIGRPVQDLELSYRPVELRSLIDQCYVDRRPVVQRDVVWRPRASTEDRWLIVEVTPLADAGGSALGASVVFVDQTVAKRLQREVEDAKQSLETAYEELQSTNEELETTNEELQSTVEELETTNEELQSTNEELETMNEELQSTNEELHTMNDELRRRGEELNDLTDFQDAIFTSIKSGVIVVDRELRVLIWSARAEELWGLRAAEAVGVNVLTLDVGLPIEQLAGPMRSVLSGQAPVVELTISAVNRRGRTIQCHVSCMPLASPDASVRGVIIMIDVDDTAQ
jgi:two-component system, chemotaxis family, CheB/CheR fusion protein